MATPSHLFVLCLCCYSRAWSWYQCLCAKNTSPPRNHCKFLPPSPPDPSPLQPPAPQQGSGAVRGEESSVAGEAGHKSGSGNFERDRKGPAQTLQLHYGLDLGSPAAAAAQKRCANDVFRTSIYDKYSRPIKITTHLYHVGHCQTTSGTNWSNRWTYRVFIVNTRSDQSVV